MLLWQLIAPESNDIAFHIQHGMTKPCFWATWPKPHGQIHPIILTSCAATTCSHAFTGFLCNTTLPFANLWKHCTYFFDTIHQSLLCKPCIPPAWHSWCVCSKANWCQQFVATFSRHTKKQWFDHRSQLFPAMPSRCLLSLLAFGHTLWFKALLFQFEISKNKYQLLTIGVLAAGSGDRVNKPPTTGQTLLIRYKL